MVDNVTFHTCRMTATLFFLSLSLLHTKWSMEMRVVQFSTAQIWGWTGQLDDTRQRQHTCLACDAGSLYSVFDYTILQTSEVIVSNVVPLLRSRSKARTNARAVVWAWDFPQLLRSQHGVHITGKDPTWRAWGSSEFWTRGGSILGTQREVVPGHCVEMRSWSASFKPFCLSRSPWRNEITYASIFSKDFL